jgi:hypothetical protein
MRWKRPIYEVGESYVIRVFAWLPISLGEETRWLERCNIRARFRHTILGSQSPWNYLEFVDEEIQCTQ